MVGGNKSFSDTMKTLTNNFRQYFGLTNKLSLQDMATYMESLTSKKLLAVPQTIYCPTDGIKLNIKKLSPKYLNREIKIKISGVAMNVSAFMITFSDGLQYREEDYGNSFTKTYLVGVPSIDDFSITFNTGRPGTVTFTDVEIMS